MRYVVQFTKQFIVHYTECSKITNVDRGLHYFELVGGGIWYFFLHKNK